MNEKLEKLVLTLIALIVFIGIIAVSEPILLWLVFGIILTVLIDYIMFNIWHYYAHKNKVK